MAAPGRPVLGPVEGVGAVIGCAAVARRAGKLSTRGTGCDSRLTGAALRGGLPISFKGMLGKAPTASSGGTVAWNAGAASPSFSNGIVGADRAGAGSAKAPERPSKPEGSSAAAGSKTAFLAPGNCRPAAGSIGAASPSPVGSANVACGTSAASFANGPPDTGATSHPLSSERPTVREGSIPEISANGRAEDRRPGLSPSCPRGSPSIGKEGSSIGRGVPPPPHP